MRQDLNVADSIYLPYCSSRFGAGAQKRVHVVPLVLAHWQERIYALKNYFKTLTKLGEFEGFAFRCVLTGPRGCTEAMRFSTSVRSDGIVRHLEPCAIMIS